MKLTLLARVDRLWRKWLDSVRKFLDNLDPKGAGNRKGKNPVGTGWL